MVRAIAFFDAIDRSKLRCKGQAFEFKLAGHLGVRVKVAVHVTQNLTHTENRL
jgi:hypothetical protein